MYLEYWGLKKHAFHNVPDPSMYFDMHESVENAVGEILFAIEEGDECLAVLVGDIGLGKTMTLRVILDALEQEKYDVAFVTNPDLTFPQLLREIIGQLRDTYCEIKSKDALLEEFNRILIENNQKGKKVLVFIDEGNAIRKVNLESLRLLTNMQDDEHNLFTLVLAGQPELAKKLEHPSMANLFQRIGVYCKLSKLKSKAILQDYIEHRCERAGAVRRIFTDDAIDRIWIHSEEGIPRLVNRLCKLAMKAGETNRLKVINGEVIDAIAERFFKTTPKKQPFRSKAPGHAVSQDEIEARTEFGEKKDTEKVTVIDSITAVPDELGSRHKNMKQILGNVIESISDKIIKSKQKSTRLSAEPIEEEPTYEDIKIINNFQVGKKERNGIPVESDDKNSTSQQSSSLADKQSLQDNNMEDDLEQHNKEVIDRMRDRYREHEDIGVFYR